MNLMPLPRGLAVLAMLLFASGCAATTTGLGKRNLEVQTKMTDTIFLEPVPPHARTILVQVRNTSDQADFDLQKAIEASIAERGYRLVDRPEEAHYLLQANVLQVGRTSPTAAEQTFAGGFGGTLIGGAAGVAGARIASDDTRALIAGGLVGAATSSVVDALVEDVTYTIVTDVQISERAGEGVVVTERLEQNLRQGSGARIISATQIHDWRRYQTRIMSTANRTNLEFEDAAPELVDGLTRSIAGIF
jgi:TraT complement resistance protein